MAKPSIQVKNLVKKYGDFTAVDDISFEVAEGDFFGFLGPNGAGKSTTMRILSTLLSKTSGTVSVGGHDIDQDPDGVRHAIGFAMQNISLDNAASGFENLQLLGVLYGLSPQQSRKRAEELVEVVGLAKVADKWVTAYSGGMRRRLDLAGVLMHDPKVLFLDEPTEGLDPQARRLIWEYLQRLNNDGSTIFLTTHYMEEADALCRNLAFIDHGKIIQEGSPASLKAKMGGDVVTLTFAESVQEETVKEALKSVLPKQEVAFRDHQAVLAVEGADQLAPKIIAALDKVKAVPKTISIAQPTLEDLFVKLIGRSIMEEDASNLRKGIDPFIQNGQ
jgi:ABC-2 type transport system ATP-binding protein